MENKGGLTPEQENFFSRGQANTRLTPETLFFVILGAILSAWVIIQVVEYIQVQNALRKVELQAKMLDTKIQQEQLEAGSQLNATTQQVDQAFKNLATSFSKQPEKKKIEGKIIHVNQD
jgi:hypothetical protein